MQEKRLRSVAAVLAAVVAAVPMVVLPSLASGAGAAAPDRQAAAAALPPEMRIGFTDERDQLYAQDLTLTRGTALDLVSATGAPSSYEDGGIGGSSADPVHVGESSARGDVRVLVSTQDSAEGEVYLHEPGLPLRRVTCDAGVETHPVVSEEGWVAYASNADQDADGALDDYDIHVAIPVGDGAGCGAWRRVDLTGAREGDDLWPAWYGDFGEDDSGGFLRERLVFSTADPGALPDLAVIELRRRVDDATDDWEVWDGDPAAWSAPERLTATPGIAETQPAVSADAAVAFTTTEDRGDGSLRLLDLDEDVSTPASYTTWEPWVGAVPSSSEAAWQSDVGSDGSQLAYTTRDQDPYGDIATAEVSESDTGPLELRPSGAAASTPGVAETHPAWIDTFDEGTSATIAYTGRAQTRGLDDDSDRVLDADVSDVARDGSGRTVRIDEVTGGVRADEAGPDYSPDGTRVAYSRSVGPRAGTAFPEREIWVADADGTDPTSLAEATGHEEGDLDRDPVWSPDGTRLAFVRERQGEAGWAPRVFVLELDGGALTAVTPEAGFDAPGTDLDNRRWEDTDPDWSPDGTQLVLRRHLTPCCEPILLRPAPGWSAGAPDRLPARAERVAAPDDVIWVVPVAPDAVGSMVVYGCGELCNPLVGRHPVWSGDRIAFVRSGVLMLATPTTDPYPDDPSPHVVQLTQLTGIVDDEPTEAGLVLAGVQEPAWSPDGTELAFSGQPIGQPDQLGLYRMAPDGTGLALVTDGRGPETEPAYQPSADLAVAVTVLGSPAVVGAPLTATFTVTNNGPLRATDVALTTSFTSGATTAASAPPAGCRDDGTGCLFGALDPGQSRSYPVTFSHGATVPAGTATGAVTSTTADPDPTNDEATASYLVGALPTQAQADLRVRIRLDSPTGYVGGRRVLSVGIRNLGPAPAEDVHVRIAWPDLLVPTTAPAALVGPTVSPTPDCLVAGDPCPVGDLASGGTERFAVVVETPTEGGDRIVARASSGTADPDPANNRATEEIEVLQPSIRLVPSVARPGQVVLAYGENMPPGTDVALSWSRGIVVDRGALTVADDGTVRQPVLIVRRDQQGDRAITATSVTDDFSAVTGEVLVVPRSISPPDLVGRG